MLAHSFMIITLEACLAMCVCVCVHVRVCVLACVCVCLFDILTSHFFLSFQSFRCDIIIRVE